MAKKYSFEVLIAVTVAFMAWYPPEVGVFVFGLALVTAVSGPVLQYFTSRSNPELAAFKKEMADMKMKVDQLVLSRGR